MKKKINNSGTTDLFFEQLENTMHIESKDIPFGKEYHFKDFTSNKNSSGTIKRFFLDSEYEIAIAKVSGKIDYEFSNFTPMENIIEVAYCFDGKAKISSFPNNSSHFLRKGEILIYSFKNNNKLFKFEYDNMHTISMNFYMDKLKANLNLSVGNPIFSEWSEKILNIFKNGELLHIKSNNEIDALALQLKNFYPYDIDSFIDFKLKVTRLFFLILKKHSESREKKTHSLISENIKSILKNTPVSELPSIKKLCEITGLNNYYLQTSFEKSEGMKISHYIRNLRMERAKFLLETTDLSILEISIEVGYENPSKFAKNFRNYFGILPSKYRKKVLEERKFK